MSVFEKQEGGTHYLKYKIQPLQYAMENGLDACQFNIVKYVTRFRDKDGMKDLKKALDCLEKLIAIEEGKRTIKPEDNQKLQELRQLPNLFPK